MKLIRFGAEGAEKPGLHIDGKNYDVSSLVTDYNEEFFAGDGIKKLENDLRTFAQTLPEIPAGTRLG